MKLDRYKMETFGIAMLSCLALGGQPLLVQADEQHHSDTHVFSIDDIQGGFDGVMFGATEGGIQDESIICGITDTNPCPGGYSNEPKEETKGDLKGVMLYPIDSEFGFYVQDFVGAAQKIRDGLYNEGWGGNLTIENLPSGEDSINYPLGPYGNIGVGLANVSTDKYKVTPPWGRHCRGAGGTSVKCETEHYVVMENIRSCYETIPYFYGDPNPDIEGDRESAQGPLYDPADYDPFFYLTGDDPYSGATPIGSCVMGQLDNLLYKIKNGAFIDPDDELDTLEPLGVAADGFPDMEPNESSVRNDIAASAHYAITKKDDGKALYRFGNMDKRPNDIRLYARLDLPDEWKDHPDVAYPVTKAKLIIRHLITNNPNDQVRSEDMENEGAMGRKPGYTEAGAQWLSDVDCFEGDGDFISAGTVMKNEPFMYEPILPPLDPSYSTPSTATDMRSFGLLADDRIDDVNGVPFPYSEDLKEGLTGAWFTTTDREPFEWAYDTDGDKVVDLSTPVEAEIGVDVPEGSVLLSGPRWRLRPAKFGQDLPGLEIPTINCMATPYTSTFIKYPVGTPTVMEHDLLDFEVESPLRTSQGWIKPNGFNEVAFVVTETGVIHAEDFAEDPNTGEPIIPEGDVFSVNGTPLTEDFDLAIYVKGDKKTTAVYNATLEIDYMSDEVQPPPDPEIDGSLDELEVPESHPIGAEIEVEALVTNLGTEVISGTVEFTGVYNRRTIEPVTCSEDFDDLEPGETIEIETEDCYVDPGVNTKTAFISWGAVLVVADDENLDNNESEGVYRTYLTNP